MNFIYCQCKTKRQWKLPAPENNLFKKQKWCNILFKK